MEEMCAAHTCASSLDVETIRKDFPILSTQVHGRELVYLDNAATTQVPLQVTDAVAHHYAASNANVHRGMHYLAHASTAAFEQARKRMASFVGLSDPSCVVFTRGTTDGLNMLARGLEHTLNPGDRVVVTVMEHHSNFVPWQQACLRRGAQLCVVGLDEHSDLDICEYERVLSGGPARQMTALPSGEKPGPVRIVAMTGCSNVLGAVNPVRRLARLAHEAGALFVLDGAQLMRHETAGMPELGCDFLSFSGHKMMAGTGIGALCGTREALELVEPRDFGGEMVGTVGVSATSWEKLPLRLEAGTPNYVGAVALSAACSYMDDLGRDAIASREDALVSHAANMLSKVEGLQVVGEPRRRAGLLSFTVEGVHPLDLCTLVDARGIALRSGHNCAQPLLSALGVTSVARMSPAFYNSFKEIDSAIEQIALASTMLRSATGSRKS